MRAAANGTEAGGFREKTGRLESFFRDEKSRGELERALGGPLCARLLASLREEDYHMLAGGLMHEGMHAGLDAAQAARLQAEFKAGTRPVQWDELRAFMAEIGYHARFGGWAAADIGASWERIAALAKDLEAYRKMARLPAGTAKDRFDRIKAQSWAQAAFIRLRAREIWQSARRMEDLSISFRKDYVGTDVPGRPRSDAGQARRKHLGVRDRDGNSHPFDRADLRALEALLETWGVWAAGHRPFPPPVTDSRAVLEQAGDIRWPAANTDAAAALMRRAWAEIEKARTIS